MAICLLNSCQLQVYSIVWKILKTESLMYIRKWFSSGTIQPFHLTPTGLLLDSLRFSPEKTNLNFIVSLQFTSVCHLEVSLFVFLLLLLIFLGVLYFCELLISVPLLKHKKALNKFLKKKSKQKNPLYFLHWNHNIPFSAWAVYILTCHHYATRWHWHLT